MKVFMRDPKTGRKCKKGQKGNWYFLFYLNGIRYYRRIYEARSRTQAWAIATKTYNEVFNGTYGKKTGQSDFVKFVRDDYLKWSRENKKSWNQDEHYSKIICSFFQGKKFADITPKLIERFKDQRRSGITRLGTQRNPNTVNREMAQLSKIFSLAKKRGYCDENPCKDVDRFRVRSRRERVLSDDEETRIMTLLNGKYAKLKPVFILALNTGMRRGEIFSIDWEDVDFQKNEIKLWAENTKNGKAHLVLMNAAARLSLIEWKSEADKVSGKIFRYSKSYAAMLFSEVCKKLDIQDVTLHTLRHTFASRLGEGETPLYVSRELMGHQSDSQTLHYTHLPVEMMREHVKRLENRSAYLRGVSDVDTF